MKKTSFIVRLLLIGMLLSVSLHPAQLHAAYAQEEAIGNEPITVTGDVYTALTPEQALQTNLAYLVEKIDNPSFGLFDGEWSILSLARSNYPVPDGFYELYYENVVAEVHRLIAVSRNEGRLDRNKGSEHSRLMLALTAIGRDIDDVGGYNVRSALADFDFVVRQGINGPIFALIASDSNRYEIPIAEEGKTQTTRENLVQYILDREIHKGTEQAGGWALTGVNPDPDITSMALQALAAYSSDGNVSAAINRAVAWLSQAQNEDGSYSSIGSVNSESTAQVIVALTGLGIDPHQDPRFIKNGQSVVDALLSFAIPEGGFMHVKPGSADAMATDQATYALVAYDRFVKGQNRLYDMTDVHPTPEVPEKPEEPEEPEKPEIPEAPEEPESGNIELELPEGDRPELIIPRDDRDYTLTIDAADRDKEIAIVIPEDRSAKTTLSLPVNRELPGIVVDKGSISLVIPKSTQVSGDASAVELISPKDPTDALIQSLIEELVPAGSRLDHLHDVITMGGPSRLTFSDFVTLTFKGMSGKNAAYIEQGTSNHIVKYANDHEGRLSGKSEYAFDNGADLIVKTKHFTDFAVYSVVESPGGDENNGGGNVTHPQPKKTVTLSVDKMTIRKGYVIAPVQVELQNGDTAWSVLQRMLDQNQIPYDYTWNGNYGSVYVQSIDGDGEFDHGSDSGWMYNVNGVYPEYGASRYTLNDGDSVQWRYTTNLGNDLGQDNSKWDNAPPISSGGPSDNQPTAEGSEQNVEVADEADNPATEESTSIQLTDVYHDADGISSWAYEAVSEATQKGLIQGHNGYFYPQNAMTRAEFTKLLALALDIEMTDEQASPFTDVYDTDWFYPYVTAAYQAGIVTGDNHQRFQPHAEMTRETMAVMIVRALELAPAEPPVAAIDEDDVSSWAKAAVETVMAANLMQGNNGYFQPKDTVTREMATVVAVRISHYLNASNELDPADEMKLKVQQQLEQTASFLLEAVTEPTISIIGGEWTVLGLARSELEIRDDYYAGYYANVEQTLTELEGKLHHVKYTEYDRVILALTSIGKPIDNVAGYDLRVPLADFDTVIKQGINGPIFALIALDSRHYNIPEDVEVTTLTTRERLIDFILAREIDGGGWALGANPSEPDPDITAMAIQGLTPYYETHPEVRAAVERGLNWLSNAQRPDGGFASWEVPNSESIAQVIVALTGLGIDPHLDVRFIKSGLSPIDALLSYATPDGGFYHVKPEHTQLGGDESLEEDLMATEQAMYALAAYSRYVNGQSRLYDMTDVN